MESEKFKVMRDKAVDQLRSGQSLTKRDGVFAPLLKRFIDSSLGAEIVSFDIVLMKTEITFPEL